MFESEPLQQLNRTYVRSGSRRFSFFSGCDYFRLASHPQVLAALRAGQTRYGLNVAASRRTTGNHRLFAALEHELAAFFKAPSATLLGSGYMTNIAVAQALAGNFSHALMDARAHPALADAARFLDCPVLHFEHRNPHALEAAVCRCGPGAKLLLLTDGLFSHDGSTAPLDQYLKVLPADALLLVDDAHGAGVVGRNGRGTPEHAGISRQRVIQTITLSKAFGVYGGAILGSAALHRRIIERSHLFVGSTPLPLPLANAALQSVRILRTHPGLRKRLRENTQYVRSRLRAHGLRVADTPGPIIALVPEAQQVATLKKALLKAGIYPPFIHYPGGPEAGYFRFVIASEHSREQLGRLVLALTGKN